MDNTAVVKAEVKSVKKKATRKPRVKTDLPATPENMLLMAMKQGASFEIIEKFLDLKERLRTQEAEIAFRQAMSNFQAECPIIPKTKIVRNSDGSIRYKYAPIETIVKYASPHLKNNGFSFNIKTKVEFQNDAPGILGTFILHHILGHTEENSYWSPLETNKTMSEQQKWGSTRTYAARYAMSDGLGLVTIDEDNDGNNPKPDNKKDAEAEKKGQEELEKVRKFVNENEYIKKGFEILGYTERAQWAFCNGNKWDAEKIKAHLNLLVDKQNGK